MMNWSAGTQSQEKVGKLPSVRSVIKIVESKYWDVLKAIRNDTKLVDLTAGVRSIRHTRVGEKILELKRVKRDKQEKYV